MKRKIEKALAVLLMLCMILPQTAMAATFYYLEVSISGPDAGGVIREVTGESSSKVNSLTTPLAADVVAIINNKYSSLEEKFTGTGLRNIIDTGLTAFASSNGDDWTTYVTTYYSSVSDDFKDTLKEKTSTFANLTVGQANQVTYTTGGGQVYTVTVTLREYYTGSSSTTTPTQPVTTKPAEDGKVSVSTSTSPADKKVTVNVTPDKGYVVNRVTVTDSKGNQIVLTATGDNNTYTFEMPADAVDVQATFIREPVAPSETKVDTMLNTDADLAYLQGKADDLFHPEQSITRGQVATIFYRLLKDANVNVTKTFDDVPEGFWCEDAVNTLAALGIVKGMNDEEFAPNKPITRAQFVAICARFAQAVAEGEKFNDVSEDYWAYDYITTASGYGWINGVGNDLFAPDRAITRAQAATIVNRMLSRIADRAQIDAGAQQYNDVPRTYWAWYDISEASTGVLPR